MKQTILAIFLLCAFFTSKCQAGFHIKVTCNPHNNGETNPAWLTNYVIAYTLDEWKHTFYLNAQLDYYALGNEKERFSYYEMLSFRSIEDAIKLAHQFKSPSDIGRFEAYMYKRHLERSKEFEITNKLYEKKPAPNSACKEVKIL